MQSSANESNSDICTYDKDTNMFLKALSEVTSVVVSAAGIIFLLPMAYGIIWYEHFGSDKKRTLLNKFVSSLCWACIEWLLIIQIFEIVNYIVGPMPDFVCLIQLHLRNAIPLQLLLFMNGIAVTRYIFIFRLKNPAAFNDDFWSFFLNMWIVGFSLITETCSRIIGPHTVYFYFCTGKMSAAESPNTSVSLPLLVLTLITLTAHLVILIKIHIYKQQTNYYNGTQLSTNWFSSNNTEDSLSDLTTTIGTAAVFSLSALFYGQANRIPLKNYSCFPYYLIEYFIRLIWPLVLGFSMILLHYYRNKKLRSSIKSELSNFVSRMNSLL
jgi:hypothetical protein